MQGLDDALKGLSVKDIVNRARNHQKRFTTEQEKVIKDIGGFVVPNAFQIPNEIIDDGWLQELSGAELKVLLFIIRKTFGFNKIAGDRIPLSQITEATGLSRVAIMSATAVLENCNLVRVIRGATEDGTRKINFYQLVIRHDYGKKKK
jgi:phage replication O-like protein O